MCCCSGTGFDGNTPCAATHAIYLRKDAIQAQVDVGDVSQVLARRLLSARGFNTQNLMVDADLVDGSNLAEKLEGLFATSEIEFVHVHHAKQGCFAALATRRQGRKRDAEKSR